MEPTPNISASTACCDVLAHGSVRATAAAVAGLRQKPGPAPSQPLPIGFLKHTDDQTVVGMAAVLRAIANGGLAAHRFTEWGVLAAPRFLGRVALANALERFAVEGAWGVSPHLIPHRSLHAVSGTISQALKIHGPNFGMGGGPGGPLEAVRTATAMVHGDRLPGVWVVLTTWNPEPAAGEVTPAADVWCTGLALALTAARPGWNGARLRLVPAERSRGPGEMARFGLTPETLHLEGLLSALTVPEMRSSVVWQFDGGGRLELERAEPSKGQSGPQAWPMVGGRVGVGSSGAGAENLL